MDNPKNSEQLSADILVNQGYGALTIQLNHTLNDPRIVNLVNTVKRFVQK
jgi:hypothetical protein